MELKSPILLRLHSSLKEALKGIAEKEKRTMSSLLVKILSDYAQSYSIKKEADTNATS